MLNTARFQRGTGVSNRLPADAEQTSTQRALDNFSSRIVATGRVPGTHTLGVEFRTVEKKVDNSN